MIERTGEEGDAPQLAAALAANMRRRGLDPIEEARAYERATEAGWPQRRIAEAVGCSPRHVSQRLRLLRLPEAVQEAIGAGSLPLVGRADRRDDRRCGAGRRGRRGRRARQGALTAAELTEHPEVVLAELAQSERRRGAPDARRVPGYHDLAGARAPTPTSPRAPRRPGSTASSLPPRTSTPRAPTAA